MSRAPALPPAVAAERRGLDTPAGRVGYYVAAPDAAGGSLPPLLLVHSVNAAGSAAEVRPLFEHYRTRRAVYAIDLPGFGSSDRSDRDYTPRLMTDAVIALADEIARERPPPEGRPALDAIALSLACEFLARAAVEVPGRFRTLGLVSPTGFSGAKLRDGPPESTLGMDWLLRTLRFPLWDRRFFELLTSRRVMRYFLERTWGSKAIDEALLDYDALTTRQPGARFAVYAFASGRLFSNDVRRVYEKLALPVWMVHGVRGDFVDYRQKRDFEGRPNWHVDVLPTGALPHFEVLDDFVRRYEAFLAEVAT